MSTNTPIVPLIFQETAGLKRYAEPVSWGVPLPKGLIHDVREIVLLDDSRKLMPLAVSPVSRWSDGSLKWVLCDMQVSLDKHEQRQFELARTGPQDSWMHVEAKQNLGLEWSVDESGVTIDTGPCAFGIGTKELFPFRHMVWNGHQCLKEGGSSTNLLDAQGALWKPIINDWRIESHTQLRLVLRLSGHFVRDKESGPQYWARIYFYAGKPLARIDFCIHNPSPARHQGGVWDLGDPGSFFFQDLSICLSLVHLFINTVTYFFDFKLLGCYASSKHGGAICPERALIR